MSLISAIIAMSGSSGTISGTIGTLINAVSVDDYGAAGDGSTNDTSAFISAIASGKNLYIPKNRSYKVVGTDGGGISGLYAAMKLNPKQYIIGEDKYTSVIKVVGDGRAIQLGNDCAVTNLTMQGAGIGAGLATNTGLLGYAVGYTVYDVVFTGFSGNNSANGGGGIFAPSVSIFANYKDGSSILNCDFISNATGLNIRDRAEYLNISNGRILQNDTGIVNRGGNNKFSNLNILENTTYGFYLLGGVGTNDGHGVMSNSTINHNGTNLAISGITQGFKLNGIMLYEGNISIVDSTRIGISASDIAGPGTLTLTNNTDVRIGAECYYPTSGGGALTKVLTGTDVSIV